MLVFQLGKKTQSFTTSVGPKIPIVELHQMPPADLFTSNLYVTSTVECNTIMLIKHQIFITYPKVALLVGPAVAGRFDEVLRGVRLLPIPRGTRFVQLDWCRESVHRGRMLGV